MIECTCGEELELRELSIRNDSFTHHFGTEYEYRVVCPDCGQELDDGIDVEEVIRAKEDWYI